MAIYMEIAILGCHLTGLANRNIDARPNLSTISISDQIDSYFVSSWFCVKMRIKNAGDRRKVIIFFLSGNKRNFLAKNKLSQGLLHFFGFILIFLSRVCYMAFVCTVLSVITNRLSSIR